jgi:antitoxin component YwqK of YwqJK toxin-antitoxin module
MKYIIVIVFILRGCSHSESKSAEVLNGTEEQKQLTISDSMSISSIVPYGLNPKTPLQKDLIEVSRINNDSLKFQNGTAYLNGRIFDGWTYQVFENNDHRYRYTKFENGKKVWQIGYYANGILDHDFHVFNDKNKGSQRMWRGDGSPYIDNFFLEGGIMHGVQKRWHSDNKLAMESKYDEGKLIYKKEYDELGNFINPE